MVRAKRVYQRLAIAVVVLLLGNQAQASTVTADAVIDLNTAITGNSWTGFAHPLVNPVQVTTGDTVNINIGFLPGQALTWNGNGFFNPWLMLTGFPSGPFESGQVGFFAWSNLSVNLTGLSQGTQFPASHLIGGASGLIHLGPTFVLDGDSIVRTFTGVTLSLLATWDSGDAMRSYSTIGYFTPMFGGDVSVSAATPLPAALPLFGTGLSLAGFIGWWRRRRAEAA